ncbi:MAG TPA: DUF2637 domain-containing protein [Candidatus Dormibacteraeota bacterium]|nr:DUF2637 domain-containing protein [Candidatus Dormibacteraeota bacterium]
MPVVLLAVVAAYGSFGHISELARRSGQHGPMAWAVAVCIDLACVVAAGEIRRDRRAGRPSVGPSVTLVCGITLSLAANVATSQPGAWSRVLAAVPCAAFVAAVGLLERRAAVSRPRKQARVVAKPAEPQPATTGHAGTEVTRALEVARQHHRLTGKLITRDALRSELGISDGKASELLKSIRPALQGV